MGVPTAALGADVVVGLCTVVEAPTFVPLDLPF